MIPPECRWVICRSAAWVSRISAVTRTSRCGLLLLDGVVQELPLEPEPGVVDQQVDRRARGRPPVLDQLQLVAVDQVGDQHLAGHAVRRRELVGDAS